MAKGVVVAALIEAGWQRDDGEYVDVEECTDVHGCERAGRWTHPHVTGVYCAQHADQARRYRL